MRVMGTPTKPPEGPGHCHVPKYQARIPVLGTIPLTKTSVQLSVACLSFLFRPEVSTGEEGSVIEAHR
jgi:hypothetical protein